MSIMILSKSEILDIAVFAARFESHMDYVTSAAEAARDLYTLNVDAFEARYGEREEPETFTARDVVNHDLVMPDDALRMLGRFEYQVCEFPGWEETPGGKAWARALRKARSEA